MNPVLTIIGVVFLAGAITGGGMKAAGHEIPVLKSKPAQVGLALVGCLALLLGLLGERLFNPSSPPPTATPPGSPSASTIPSQAHTTPPGTAGPVAARQPAATFGCDRTDNVVESVAVHPSGLLVACVSGSTTAVWAIENRAPSQAKDLGVGALAAAFDPAGNVLLTAGSSCWQLFEGNRPWNRIGSSECGMDEQAAGVAFAPDGKSFATRPFASGSTIRFWDIGSHKITNTYTADNGKTVRAIAYSPAGRYFATGSDDAHPYLWDLGSSGQYTALTDDRGGHAEAVYAVAFSPDGTRLVSGSGDRTAKVWSVPEGKLLTSLDGEHGGSVKAVVFSPDGRTVVTGGEDRKVVVWDVATGKPVRKLEGSGGAISSLSFHRDGKILAAGCSDGKVVVWSLT
jgi:WD40 repeat protein